MSSDQEKPNPADPLLRAELQRVATLAEEIYGAHKARLERRYNGYFAAVDVVERTISVGRYAESAMQAARQKNPAGLFHLIKIGSQAAFHSSHLSARMQHARRLGAN